MGKEQAIEEVVMTGSATLWVRPTPKSEEGEDPSLLFRSRREKPPQKVIPVRMSRTYHAVPIHAHFDKCRARDSEARKGDVNLCPPVSSWCNNLFSFNFFSRKMKKREHE